MVSLGRGGGGEKRGLVVSVGSVVSLGRGGGGERRVGLRGRGEGMMSHSGEWRGMGGL